MYRINDKPAAIRAVQEYLRTVGDENIFIFPSGIYDDNTKEAVRKFQSNRNLEPTGEVDRITFDLIFSEHILLTERDNLRRITDSFITFPLYPGRAQRGMTHINRILANLLDYYGFTHRLRGGDFYSLETEEAVRILREIYLLENANLIDEDFYIRITKDHDSIGLFNNNFH